MGKLNWMDFLLLQCEVIIILTLHIKNALLVLSKRWTDSKILYKTITLLSVGFLCFFFFSSFSVQKYTSEFFRALLRWKYREPYSKDCCLSNNSNCYNGGFCPRFWYNKILIENHKNLRSEKRWSHSKEDHYSFTPSCLAFLICDAHCQI